VGVRPATRSSCASPPAYPFNCPFTAGHPETGERTGANRSAQNACGVKPRAGTSWKYGWLPVTFLPGQIIYADCTAGTTGPQLLYPATSAGNLMSYRDGTDEVGHAAEQLSGLIALNAATEPAGQRMGRAQS
jgi:hypothetical protein